MILAFLYRFKLLFGYDLGLAYCSVKQVFLAKFPFPMHDRND